jgi:two-component system chemotaxis sensor kinase CheA
LAPPDRKYLALFVAESREQLAALGSELVALEAKAGSGQTAPPPAELWDSIFRRVHSIKGSAATLELGELVAVSHAAEALTGRLRAAGLPITREQIDLLLESADALGRLVEQAAREESSAESGSALLAERLTGAASKLEAAAPPPRKSDPPVALAPPPAAPDGTPVWEVVISLSPKCAAPGARAMIVQRRLRALGALLEMEPTPQQLMQTRGAARITARVATGKKPDEIRFACQSVPEVDAVEVLTAGGKKVLPAPEPRAPEPEPRKAVPAADAPGQATPALRDERRPESTIRVRAEALDQLLDAAGEVLGGIARLREGARKLPENVGPGFEAEIDRLRRLARELHGKVMNARLTPFSVLTERLPRAVRDLSHKLGKEVDFEVQGADVELDRSMIEAMGDPLSHLVRNAVDHGFEAPADREKLGKSPRGKLTLRARRERDRVLIDLEDDGRGIDVAGLRRKSIESGALTAEAAAGLTDAQAAELAFLPGVSTRNVATEISGRGVGLDAVQRSVESVGGKLSVASRPGRGTQFTLELPRSVSMSNLLLVQVGGELFGLPVTRVALTIEYDPSARGGEGFESKSVIVAGQWVHSWSLAKLFGLPSLAPPGPRPFVVLEVDGATFALGVDRLVGQEEAVVRPLFPPLDRVKGLAGTCVLGNGRPLLVLDPRGLSEMAGVPRGPGPLREAVLQGAA